MDYSHNYPPLFPPPLLHAQPIQHTCAIGRYSGQIASPPQVAQVSFCEPFWPRMSRQLSQLPTPDLPAGASPQFGSCTQPAGSLTGGQLNSMAGLKSLLQHPMKGDQRLRSPCDAKGEVLFMLIVHHLTRSINRTCQSMNRSYSPVPSITLQ